MTKADIMRTLWMGHIPEGLHPNGRFVHETQVRIQEAAKRAQEELVHCSDAIAAWESERVRWEDEWRLQRRVQETLRAYREVRHDPDLIFLPSQPPSQSSESMEDAEAAPRGAHRPD